MAHRPPGLRYLQPLGRAACQPTGYGKTACIHIIDEAINRQHRSLRPRRTALMRLPSLWTVDLKVRCRQPELMDEPDCDLQQHLETLRALRRINQLSHRDYFLWLQLLELARTNGGRPLRVLDIATGGGDLPIGLWHRAKQANLA